MVLPVACRVVFNPVSPYLSPVVVPLFPQPVPISNLAGIGPQRSDLLARLNIATVDDLLWFLPRRYEDRRVPAGVDQLDKFGRLDCACNNAAGAGGFNPIQDVQAENWDHCHNVTLKGVWLCMKYQIPVMLEAGAGAIVNIASLSGVRGEAHQSPYSAAKGGVIALTRTAAAENAQLGIRGNAVNPGGILTRALANYFDKVPGEKKPTANTHAMRRLGRPEEIADAVAYLCSDRASFITGHALNVDGGIMVNPHTL